MDGKMTTMRVRLAAFGLLGLFIGIEPLLRQGEAAKRLSPTPDDRDTTRALGEAYAEGLLLGLVAPFLSAAGLGRMRWRGPLGAAGLVTMLAGLGLKVWAMRTLGAAYTRTLQTAAEQPLVQAGPYRRVRHPGYFGAILLWTGFGLASANWLAAGVIGGLVGRAYLRRIAAEEEMLVAAMGQRYAAYQRTTSRLVPGLY
jgi:protein-S-isoprenylcysteine O-methyltransferase Ste14